MQGRERIESRSGAIGGETRGRVVVGQIVPAVSTVKVGDADAFVANAAVRRDSIGALRTVIDVAVHFGAAARALGQDWLPQEKVQHRADATLQDDTQQNPQPFTHIATRRVLADISDHQHVNRNQSAPGSTEVNVHWKRATGSG